MTYRESLSAALRATRLKLTWADLADAPIGNYTSLRFQAKASDGEYDVVALLVTE